MIDWLFAHPVTIVVGVFLFIVWFCTREPKQVQRVDPIIRYPDRLTLDINYNINYSIKGVEKSESKGIFKQFNFGDVPESNESKETAPQSYDQ